MSSKIFSGIFKKSLQVGVSIPITLILFSSSVFAFGNWVTYVPSASQVELSYLENDGISYMNVTIWFSSSGYRVTDWGRPHIVENKVSVDAAIWDWTGLEAQVMTPKSHLYSFGNLPEAQYLFTFKAWGSSVKNFTFTASGTPGKTSVFPTHYYIIAPLIIIAGAISIRYLRLRKKQQN